MATKSEKPSPPELCPESRAIAFTPSPLRRTTSIHRHPIRIDEIHLPKPKSPDLLLNGPPVPDHDPGNRVGVKDVAGSLGHLFVAEA